jgi:hypothetical protein
MSGVVVAASSPAKAVVARSTASASSFASNSNGSLSRTADEAEFHSRL